MDDLALLKKQIQEDMVEAVAMLLPRLVEKGMTSEDPDTIRKIIGTIGPMAGVEAEKRVDQFANLPMTNIQIVMSGAAGTVQGITVDVEPQLVLKPTAAMLANASINEDVDFDE